MTAVRKRNPLEYHYAKKHAAELVTSWDYATLQCTTAPDRLVGSWGLERVDAVSIVTGERRRRSSAR